MRQGWIVVGLMAGLAAVLFLQREVVVPPATDLLMDLPAQVGDYTGRDRFFCQNELCLKSFPDSEAGSASSCPACGGRLDRVSLGEKQLLPKDTIISRKEYRDPAGEEMAVTIVLSGSEQKSIHRPQQCLPAQGYSIEGQQVISVPLTGRSPLKVMRLDVRRTLKASDGRTRDLRSCYAYWFVGKGRETPHHWQRLLWMSSDMLLRNVTHRWAYVAISTSRPMKDGEGSRKLSDFVSRLHPCISAEASKPPVSR